MGQYCGAPPKVPEVPVVVEPPREIDYKQIHSKVRWNRDFDDVKEALFSKDACNCIDPGNGNSPLHIAAQNGHLNVTKLLLERGADPNAQNAKGNTALHMAISYDYYECAQAIMASGADIERVNAAGHPARKGLDGDKSLVLLRLLASTTTDEIRQALKECAANKSDFDKAAYINYGLKTKKAVKKTEPPVWTDEINAEFTAILETLS